MSYPGACQACGFQRESHRPDGDASFCARFVTDDRISERRMCAQTWCPTSEALDESFHDANDSWDVQQLCDGCQRDDTRYVLTERTLEAKLDGAPEPIGYVVLTKDDDRNRCMVATVAEALADKADQDAEWPNDGPHRVCALIPVNDVEDTP